MRADTSAESDGRQDRNEEESLLEQLDRNWNEPLHELRVTQTGVQLFAGFVLTLGCRCTRAPPNTKTAEAPRLDGEAGERSLIVCARLVHPTLDLVHHRGVGERRDVTHVTVLCHVAQQPAHDLARARLG